MANKQREREKIKRKRCGERQPKHCGLGKVTNIEALGALFLIYATLADDFV